jgi:hypothetical protein
VASSRIRLSRNSETGVGGGSSPQATTTPAAQSAVSNLPVFRFRLVIFVPETTALAASRDSIIARASLARHAFAFQPLWYVDRERLERRVPAVSSRSDLL